MNGIHKNENNIDELFVIPNYDIAKKYYHVKIIDKWEKYLNKDLINFDCLIISVDHKQFKIPKKILERYLKNCKLIIDHDGAWKKYNLKNNYHLSGDHGWL